jgi:hypothetical protein
MYRPRGRASNIVDSNKAAVKKMLGIIENAPGKEEIPINSRRE